MENSLGHDYQAPTRFWFFADFPQVTFIRPYTAIRETRVCEFLATSFLIAFPLGDIFFPSHRRSNSFQTPSFAPKIPKWDFSSIVVQHPFLRKCTRLKLNTDTKLFFVSHVSCVQCAMHLPLLFICRKDNLPYVFHILYCTNITIGVLTNNAYAIQKGSFTVFENL